MWRNRRGLSGHGCWLAARPTDEWHDEVISADGDVMKEFPALMYHSISRASGPLRKLGVPPGLLADQLGLLRSHGYELVGLTEALALTATDPSRAVIALTFDD